MHAPSRPTGCAIHVLAAPKIGLFAPCRFDLCDATRALLPTNNRAQAPTFPSQIFISCERSDCVLPRGVQRIQFSGGVCKLAGIWPWPRACAAYQAALNAVRNFWRSKLAGLRHIDFTLRSRTAMIQSSRSFGCCILSYRCVIAKTCVTTKLPVGDVSVGTNRVVSSFGDVANAVDASSDCLI